MAKGNPNPKTEHLAPWQFKKGQIANPTGRGGGGVSLKERVKAKLAKLTDKQLDEYLEGLNKLDVWKMGEGNPKTDIEADIEITKKVISVDE